jgi:hypothetical protein
LNTGIFGTATTQAQQGNIAGGIFGTTTSQPTTQTTGLFVPSTTQATTLTPISFGTTNTQTTTQPSTQSSGTGLTTVQSNALATGLGTGILFLPEKSTTTTAVTQPILGNITSTSQTGLRYFRALILIFSFRLKRCFDPINYSLDCIESTHNSVDYFRLGIAFLYNLNYFSTCHVSSSVIDYLNSSG